MASRTDLSMLIENRGTMLEECLGRVKSGEVSGGLFFDIGFHYRLMAIAHLLLSGEATRFTEHLTHSGQARLHYLQHVNRAAAGEAEFLCCANDKGWEAFAVVGDLEGARGIAQLQPTTVYRHAEYEEDFLWKRLLYALLGPDGNEADREGRRLVAALETTDSDTAPAKAAIGRALVGRDGDAYARAFSAWVESRRVRFEELSQTPGFAREHLITERHVFLLGLAVEQIARQRGLPPVESPSLPAAARLPIAISRAPADSWLHFDGS